MALDRTLLENRVKINPRRGGKFTGSFSPQIGQEYVLAIIPQLSAKGESFPGQKEGTFVDLLLSHRNSGAGGKQPINCGENWNLVCPVCDAGHKVSTRWFCLVVILTELMQVNEKGEKEAALDKAGNPVFIPVSDFLSWDLPASAAEERYLSVIQNKYSNANDDLTKLAVWSYKRSGTGLDTVHALMQLPANMSFHVGAMTRLVKQEDHSVLFSTKECKPEDLAYQNMDEVKKYLFRPITEIITPPQTERLVAAAHGLNCWAKKDDLARELKSAGLDGRTGAYSKPGPTSYSESTEMVNLAPENSDIPW